MENQIAELGEGVSDIGAGLFFAGIAIAIAWHRVGRMRWRSPMDELQKLHELKSEDVISEKEHEKLRRKILDRF